jgi:sugar phosphate isomerase/epimerase
MSTNKLVDQMEIGVSLGPEPEEISKVPQEFEFVELAIGEKEIDPEEIDVEQVKQDLEEKNLGLVVHLPFRQPLATKVDTLNEAALDYFDELIEVSEKLGAEKAVVHANAREEDDEENIEYLANQVEILSKLGEPYDIEVCIENVGQWDGIELFRLGEILEDQDVSMCFDTGHAFAEVGQEETEEFLEEHLELISHLHVQDTREGRDLHLCIGEGEIEWESLGSRLKGFNGTACLEVFTNDDDYQKLSREKFLNALTK